MADPSQSIESTGTATTSTSVSPPASTSSLGTAVPGQAPLPDSADDESLRCQWHHCFQTFETPELLYKHLTDVHVGRKVTNDLTLTCGWGNCCTTTVKRDHITSHVRVHVPFKPHRCTYCGKRFKRPQDLKKHVKTHAEDTVVTRGPDQLGPRPRGPGFYNGRSSINDLQALAATATGYYSNPMQPGPTGHQSYGPPGQGANSAYFGGQQQHYGSDLYAGGQGGGPAGQQRLGQTFGSRRRDYEALNDFFGAVKRREINPGSYEEVAEGLMALHGVDLPMLGLDPPYQPGPTMVPAGGHEGSVPRQQQSVPAFSNLRTKNDLLNMGQFLDQIQTTAYEDGNRVTAPSVLQQGELYLPAGLHVSQNDMARPIPHLNHMKASPETTMAQLPSSTLPISTHLNQMGTSRLTPTSALSQRSEYSPGSMGSDSAHGTPPIPSSSAASIYPGLPAMSSRGVTHSAYSNSNTTPVSGLGPAFHSDQRQRYSGQMQHKAARPDGDRDMADVNDIVASSPTGSRRSSNVRNPASMEAEVVAQDIPLSMIDPALSRMDSPVAPSSKVKTQDGRTQDIIQKLQRFITARLNQLDFEEEETDDQDGDHEMRDARSQHHDDGHENDNEAAQVSRIITSQVNNVAGMEKDVESLYPVLRAIEGAH